MNKKLFSPNAQRCGAYARTTGKPCKKAAMKNGRCRNHGGKSLKGIESPQYKHGCRTKAFIDARHESKALVKDINDLMSILIR